MLNKTNIDWVKNPDGTQGYTWNPITGCLNHKDGLCNGGGFPCYAYRLANTRLKERYLANKNIAPVVGNILLPNLGFVEMNPFYPRFWPERLGIFKKRFVQLHNCITYPKKLGIFPCDMSDLFGIGIPEEWTRLVLEVIRINAYDRFYLLTKQPQNLIKWSPFPQNCYVGVTATDDNAYTFATHYLEKVEAKVKYISFEPLLTVIDCGKPWDKRLKLAGVNLVIIGAQTKPLKRPHPSWVREITEAGIKAGIAVFHKNNLKETGGVLRIILNDDQFKEVYGVDFKQELPKGLDCCRWVKVDRER